ncbi:MAG: A24 family peptidase [Spirochaetaceae bacterium]|jgi:prepilin signal peptidase PulO-like enzyme (type II secretory pathway)|nr:A24 family peptidase [Spirochaetaceae bacterium]
MLKYPTMITALFISLLLLCTLWDIKTLRIPNLLSLGGFAILLTLQWIIGEEFPKSFLFSAFLSFVIMLSLVLGTRGKLGMGDAKLTLSIAGVLGLYYWFISLAIASVIALITALVLLGCKKMDKETPIPFAPFLSLGAMLSLWLMKEGYFAL